MYRLIRNPITKEIDTVKRLADGAFIPFDERNMDYQDYLRWCADGNAPEQP